MALDADIDTVLDENTVETYITNGAIDLDANSTVAETVSDQCRYPRTRLERHYLQTARLDDGDDNTVLSIRSTELRRRTTGQSGSRFTGG